MTAPIMVNGGDDEREASTMLLKEVAATSGVPRNSTLGIAEEGVLRERAVEARRERKTIVCKIMKRARRCSLVYEYVSGAGWRVAGAGVA